MKYQISIGSSAQKQFKKFPVSIQENITLRILSLEDNPRPHGSQKLRASDFYRIRQGDYRVVYFIDDKRKVVEILDVDHRKDIYR